MSERFGKIFTLDKKLWYKDSPVLIEKEALLKDFYVNQYLVQLKFINLSSKTITGFTIKILYCDKINNKSGEAEFTYTDLNALKGEYFGDRKPLYIPDENARDFEFTITKVVFDDNSQWNNENRFTEIATNKAYAEINIIEQLKRELNTYENISIPEFSDDHWYCVCGQFNINSEDECCKCKRNKEELRKVSDINILADNLKNYEQKQADKQKKIAEQKKKRLKKLKAVCVIAIITVIGIICVKSMTENKEYKRTVELFENGDYVEAENKLENLEKSNDINTSDWIGTWHNIDNSDMKLELSKANNALHIKLSEIFGETIKVRCNSNISTFTNNYIINFKDDSGFYDIRMSLFENKILLKIVDKNKSEMYCFSHDEKLYSKYYIYVRE